MLSNIIKQINKIYIDKQAEILPITNLILSRMKNTQYEIINNPQKLIEEYGIDGKAIDKGKKELLITIQKGRFFKPCPGTKHYLCCLYKIIHQSSNCPIDCSYCVLQTYFNNPFLTIYANEEDMYKELEKEFIKRRRQIIRIGTGEFNDSLALDPITDFSKRIIPFVLKYDNIYLELKTKSTFIDNFINIDGKGRVFTAWSLNPDEIINSEERESPTLKERLTAAKKCEDAGFPLCFHFDPIIRFEGWEKAYKKTISSIFDFINPEHIVYISLGCLRFPQSMKNMINERFPNSNILLEEFVLGMDDKVRYFKPLRIEMFRLIYNEMRKYAPNVLIYLCMESDEIWRQVMGWSPKTNKVFSNLLDERCSLFG